MVNANNTTSLDLVYQIATNDYILISGSESRKRNKSDKIVNTLAFGCLSAFILASNTTDSDLLARTKLAVDTKINNLTTKTKGIWNQLMNWLFGRTASLNKEIEGFNTLKSALEGCTPCDEPVREADETPLAFLKRHRDWKTTNRPSPVARPSDSKASASSSSNSIDPNLEPMPVKNQGESDFLFAIRLSAWERANGKALKKTATNDSSAPNSNGAFEKPPVRKPDESEEAFKKRCDAYKKQGKTIADQALQKSGSLKQTPVPSKGERTEEEVDQEIKELEEKNGEEWKKCGYTFKDKSQKLLKTKYERYLELKQTKNALVNRQNIQRKASQSSVPSASLISNNNSSQISNNNADVAQKNSQNTQRQLRTPPSPVKKQLTLDDYNLEIKTLEDAYKTDWEALKYNFEAEGKTKEEKTKISLLKAKHTQYLNLQNDQQQLVSANKIKQKNNGK